MMNPSFGAIALLLLATTADADDPTKATWTLPTIEVDPGAIEWRFVDVTTTLTRGRVEFDGHIGYSAMHAMCAEEVDPDARACFSEEMARSVAEIPLVDENRRAWILPSAVEWIYNPLDGLWEFYDPTVGGALVLNATSLGEARSRLACSNFHSDSNTPLGPIIINGRFSAMVCSAENPIACCAPTRVSATH